jgi:MinD-like ATPase involved in chromosome partitioning or flagellar assembly
MQFLDVRLRFSGHIPMSQRIRKAVVSRKPITIQKSDLPEVMAFQSVAKQVLDAPVNQTNGIRFFQKGMSGGG